MLRFGQQLSGRPNDCLNKVLEAERLLSLIRRKEKAIGTENQKKRKDGKFSAQCLQF